MTGYVLASIRCLWGCAIGFAYACCDVPLIER